MERMTRLRAARPLGKPPTRVISFDEIWTYVGVRRGEERRRHGSGRRRWRKLTGGRFEARNRCEETFSRLLERLLEALRYRSDDYVVYGLLPRDRHVMDKGGEVNRNEGTHSRLRDRLRRLRRKTKRYGKSVAMLRESIALVYPKPDLI